MKLIKHVEFSKRFLHEERTQFRSPISISFPISTQIYRSRHLSPKFSKVQIWDGVNEIRGSSRRKEHPDLCLRIFASGIKIGEEGEFWMEKLFALRVFWQTVMGVSRWWNLRSQIKENMKATDRLWRERKLTRCNNQMFIINFCLNMFRVSFCPSSGEQRPCVTACGVLRWFCWTWLVAVVGRCVAGCPKHVETEVDNKHESNSNLHIARIL